MPSLAQTLAAEVQNEGKTTRRVLDRVPAERSHWQPHRKSMSLGQLAAHIAALPGAISRMASGNEIDMARVNFRPEPAASAPALLAMHDASIASATEFLNGLSDEDAMATFRMHRAGHEIFSLPRLAVMRILACNHLYHHRGQLTVYLRLLDVPLPSVYGPTADENPFA